MKFILHTKSIIISILLLVTAYNSYAQNIDPNDELIQFSGLLLNGADLRPVQYANITINKNVKGTFSDKDGFFSIVVQKKDHVSFTSIGYKSVKIVIPDTLKDARYSIVQLMTQDVYNLPETIIFPWPSREHFKTDFLAMDVKSDLQLKAISNLAAETLSKMRNEVKYDGKESANFYMRQQAQTYYYFGQKPAMNLFSPLAWAQFFKAWKEGKFKRKFPPVDEND
ncbi:MAG: carboxypeptidase-like regulatory domain-containing protein [Saprospiraceae bacterium]|nr:carboxypeptidase-like regulatory domain-containing protein [Saprospiraceae bacterium]